MDRRDELRAADADREAVAEQLRVAVNEGRLDLHEYDDRLQRAYAARTYGELDVLLTDLPGTVPAERAQLAPVTGVTARSGLLVGPDGRNPQATRRWLAENWSGYLGTVGITVAIWAVVCVMSRDLVYFWPGWVAGPWGAVLLVSTISGLMSGEPQKWAAKRARKEQEKADRRAVTGSGPGDDD
ncbi:DUF1707 domain-containing protein [Micromonospora sp. NPDC049679]|uniref:DUF1707 SHOCT-like domain-containing protein n=1 Tax=Micromonospora sp. NPDC049679 TaxID=3155920 RepID=UPI0033CF184A